MASIQLYIESNEIANDTQLMLQEHKVQELIAKQIHLENDGYNNMNLLTILISLGAMVISLTTISNSENAPYAYLCVAVILVASIGFALYEKNKQHKNQEAIQKQIMETMIAINTYKIGKEEIQKSQDK